MQLAQLQGRKQDAQRLQEELDKLQTAQNLLSQLPPVVKLEDGSVKEEDGSPPRKRAKRAIDPQRREALFARLAANGEQVWMTGTERLPFDPILPDAAVWDVSRGSLRRI